MIVINTEQGLIRIKKWEDITELAGYVPQIDPKESKLETITGRYIFREPVKCGLSNCGTLHKRGYVVKTPKGEQSNIGKDCGKKHFGVEFEELSRQFDRDLEAQENREQLSSAQFKVEEQLQRISDIQQRERGANWVNRSLKSFWSTLPRLVKDRVYGMVKSRDPKITVSRLATSQELAILKEAKELDEGAKEAYITDTVGTLSGFTSLYKENDIRELLIVDLQSGLKGLLELDISSFTEFQLKKHVKWAGQVDSKFDKAEVVIGDANKFFQTTNLLQLLSIAQDPEEQKVLKSYAKKF
jgi:hypothetical protein